MKYTGMVRRTEAVGTPKKGEAVTVVAYHLEYADESGTTQQAAFRGRPGEFQAGDDVTLEVKAAT